MRPRHLPLLASLLGLWATQLLGPSPAPAEAAPPSPPLALLLPLDDRPSTRLFPSQIARIGGGTLSLPPRALLGRAWTPGQPRALAAWIRAAAPSADHAILSLDMLCYGGLVASRSAGAPLEEAVDRLRLLDELQASGVEVELFATLPRLSLRTSERQAPFERRLAGWAARGEPSPPEGVPLEVVEEYLGVRRRNVAVLEAALEKVASGAARRLTLGQDDAAPRGPHIEEQRQLVARAEALRIRDRVRLVSGADEVAMNLVAGWLCRAAGLRPRVEVTLSDPAARARIPPLESRPLGHSIEQHLAMSGALEAGPGEPADLRIHLEVPSPTPFAPPGAKADPGEPARAEALLETLRAALRRERPVALADLRLVNRADPALAEALLREIPLWRLDGYAAWNTPSNALGCALAQAVARQVARARAPGWPLPRRLESEKTHLAFTFARLVDDFAYQARIRARYQPAAALLPRDPAPLLNLYGPIGVEIRQETLAWVQAAWRERLQGRSFPSPVVGQPVTLTGMTAEVLLPWPRVFEIEARLDLRLSPGEPPRLRGGSGWPGTW